MQISLFGYGKMGKLIEQIAPEKGHRIVPFEKAEVCIDFSHAEAVFSHVKQACLRSIPIVIGTTGWEDRLDEVKKWIESKGRAALYAPNFSLGMQVFLAAVKKARELLAPFPEYDVGGIEWHHHQKQDAPSGTAKMIAQNLDMLSPFTSVRLGSMPGKHTVIFDSPFETLTFSHQARSQMSFAEGAIRAAEWIVNQKGWYTLDDMLRPLYSSNHSL